MLGYNVHLSHISILIEIIIFNLCFHDNEVEKGGATGIESKKVENAQELPGLCVNKEQPQSHQAIEEQGHETYPILDTDGVTEIFESIETKMEYI